MLISNVDLPKFLFQVIDLMKAVLSVSHESAVSYRTVFLHE